MLTLHYIFFAFPTKTKQSKATKPLTSCKRVKTNEIEPETRRKQKKENKGKYQKNPLQVYEKELK